MKHTAASAAQPGRRREVEPVVCRIDITWDVEGAVWAATSRDVPELALEDPSLERLRELVCQTLASRPGEAAEPRFRYTAPCCR